MIAVLCYSCSTHIATTDVDRLDWPLTGAMFSPAYPGWYLRPGMLNLDIFCPACQMFPFSHDPNVAGGNAVGKALNVRGADGKPVVMTVKQILMSGGVKKNPTGADLMGMLSPYQKQKYQMDFKTCLPICPDCGQWCLSLKECKAYQEIKDNDFRAQPALVSVNDGKQEQQGNPSRTPIAGGRAGVALPGKSVQSPAQNSQGLAPGGAFPCPSCGAKKRFHKKGCALAVMAAGVQGPPATHQELKRMEARVQREEVPPPDPHLLAMEARVSSGPERGEQPTIDDLKDLERDRESRASGRPEPELRPGEGFAAKVGR